MGRKPRGRARNGDGSVFTRTHKRANGTVTKWYAEIMINGEVHKSKPCNSEDEAEKWLTLTRARNFDGMLAAPTKETVGQYVKEWIDNTASMDVGPATLRLYNNLFDWYVNPHLGKVKLQELRPEQIRGMFRRLLDSGKSGRTVQLCRGLLRRALNQAVEDGKLARNPTDAAKAPKAKSPPPKVLTAEQIQAFIEAAEPERLKALFILAVTSAMRQGELIALRWQDVDLKAGSVTVSRTRKVIHVEKEVDGKTVRRDGFTFGDPKTEAGKRTIPLAQVAIDALKSWKTMQDAEMLKVGKGHDRKRLVFTSEVGTPLNPRNVRDDGFRRICERIGLAERRPRMKPAKDGSVTRVVPLMKFHDLRHTAVTYMLANGVKPEVVQKVAGHSDITVTLRIYRQVFEEEKKEAAQVFDNLKAAHKKAR